MEKYIKQWNETCQKYMIITCCPADVKIVHDFPSKGITTFEYKCLDTDYTGQKPQIIVMLYDNKLHEINFKSNPHVNIINSFDIAFDNAFSHLQSYSVG